MVQSIKRDSKAKLDADSLYTVWAIVWTVHFADRCSLENSIPSIRPPSQATSAFTDLSPVWNSFPHVFGVDLDAEGQNGFVEYAAV